MTNWIAETFFYHIFPLGFCGAPQVNDFSSEPLPRLEKISTWLDHIQVLGANALLLGPVFESTSHGYDTADFYHVDRRLGRRSTLAQLSGELHRRGMRLVLDGVFNHVGRNFWAFRDVLQQGRESPYRDWFSNLRFDCSGPYQDGFSYEGWNGHYDLVKLNLNNPAVKNHLFQAIEMWVNEFNIDGLRLDAADCLDAGFMRELSSFCQTLRPDFWLMGEVIHGNYRRWASAEMLDSVTNYEVYKGLYSSLVDRNYFEIAYSLNRQFGPSGIYRDLQLYNFADNHDVSRVASSLGQPSLLYPLYLLLFTMPGVPALYYGSEWGIECQKTNGSDWPLRPCLNLDAVTQSAPQSELPQIISRLSHLRRSLPALQQGSYQELMVEHQLFAFRRIWKNQQVVVVINSSDRELFLDPAILPSEVQGWFDCLNPTETLKSVREEQIAISPCWGRILQL